ncbi:hypothetical protein [Sorangium sp. So ce1099]|uniref:hypothetical protein n=1 Tax=Sorangium sp. So ce1099 TaxID=3133331 RepID=UPI003F617575
MKTRNKLLLAVFAGCLIGFIIASQCPVLSVLVKLSDDTVTGFQRLDLLVRILAAAGTFLAVVVALFKEDIRRLWEHANIELNPRDSDWIREILEGSTDDDDAEGDSSASERDAPSRRAEKYEAAIQVKNTGNVPAKSCEIRLDRLIFKPQADANGVEVDSSDTALSWRGTTEPRIAILPDRHATVEVVVLTAPTGPKAGSRQASLRIGNNAVVDRSGTWVATFSVFGENVRLTKIDLTIWWDGQWEHRKTEMSRRFTVKGK